jgi:serine/threonine protein kinase
LDPDPPPKRSDQAQMYGIESLLAGRTLMERYLIREVIGKGGMGVVYRARDGRLGRDVAVKVVTVAALDEAGHQRLRARFQREARAAARLHHPNVVAVHDFGTDAELGLDFLVMELLRGEDLAARLARDGPPPVGAALDLLCQAARGLAAGHRAGLVHRDVKPGNLFLERDDGSGDTRLKVLDFGIADITAAEEATVTHLTMDGRSPFSPAFASPEQLRGDSSISPSSDVFSLGAVAYQMFTGQRAFTATDPRKAVIEVSAAAAALGDLASAAPAGARDIIRRCLAPHPGDRYPDAAAVAAALTSLGSPHASRGAEPDRSRRNPQQTRVSAPPTHAGDLTRTVAEPAWEPDNSRRPHRDQRLADPERSQRVGPRGEPLSRELQSVLDGRPAPRPNPYGPSGSGPGVGAPASVQPAARHTPPAVTPARGRIARAASATLSVVVTAVSVALFGACWTAIVTGLQNGDMTTVYAGAAASVACTPLALHRLLRRRGSFRLALFASLTGSIGAVYLLADSQRIEMVLLAMLGAQVAMSLGAERLTRRRRETLPDPPV